MFSADEERRTLNFLFWGLLLLLFPYSVSLRFGEVQLSFDLTWIVAFLLLSIAVFRRRETKNGKGIFLAASFGLALLLIVPLLSFLIIRNAIPQIDQIAENLLNLILYPEEESAYLSSIFLLLQANYGEMAMASCLIQIVEGGIFLSVIVLIGKYLRELCTATGWEEKGRIDKDMRILFVSCSVSLFAQLIAIGVMKGMLGKILVEEGRYTLLNGFTPYLSVLSVLIVIAAIGGIFRLVYLIRVLTDIQRLRQKGRFSEGEKKE